MKYNTNSQKLFIKECLFISLMNLMKKKSIYDITITELTKKAGVSRMAYYRNYDNILDIITDFLDRTTLGVNKENSTKLMYLPDTLHNVFTYFSENKLLINNLINANMTDLILNAIEKHFKTTFYLLLFSYGFQHEYEVSALVGIFYKILIDWSKKGMIESTEEMTSISFAIISKFENY
jgi:Transcriptional regulator